MNSFWAVNKIDNTTSEILLYGYIGLDDVKASDFVAALKALEKTSNKINVRINSGGGSIFEGIAIFNAIRNSTSEITGYIDGLAASMASIIAIAPKKVYMSKAAMLMTHRANGAVIGNANDLRNYAQLLENLEATLSDIYSKKTGISKQQAMLKYMGSEDKWFTANEALQEKIIDGIYDSPVAQAPLNIRNEMSLVSFYSASLQPSNRVQIPNLLLPEHEQKRKEEIYKSENVNELIQEALSENNITKEQADILREQWQGQPEKLIPILDEMAKLRINYLMNLDWDELDKKGLNAELLNKFKAGFEIKWFLQFGKQYKGEKLPKDAQPADYINYNDLIDFAVNWKYISQETGDEWKQGKGIGASVDMVLEKITSAPLTFLQKYENMTWEELDKCDGVSYLKEFSYPLYKKKFFDRFGVYPREDE